MRTWKDTQTSVVVFTYAGSEVEPADEFFGAALLFEGLFRAGKLTHKYKCVTPVALLQKCQGSVKLFCVKAVGGGDTYKRVVLCQSCRWRQCMKEVE